MFDVLKNRLSKRRKEVYSLLESGYSYDDICKKLWITKSTIKTHLCVIFKQCGFHGKEDFYNHIIRTRENEIKVLKTQIEDLKAELSRKEIL